MRKVLVSPARVCAAAAGAVAFVLLSGSGSCRNADPVTLTVFHTNDLHSYYVSPKADEFGLGGFARLATLMKQRRDATQNPYITLDAGDYSEANWYFNIDTGATTLRMMEKMGIDAACLGNHDYIMAPDRLLDTVREADVDLKVLAANLDFSKWPHEEEFRKEIGNSAIFERDGIKIGVIGLTTPEITYAPFLAPLVATDPVEATRAEAEKLRPQVDVLIVVSHISFNTNVHIAEAVPGIDAVISGHSHKKVSRAVLVKNAGKEVPVVETGSHARFLGELKLTYDREYKTVKFKSYQLHPVFPTIPEDAGIKAMIEEADAKLRAKYGEIDQVVATSEVELRNDDTHRASLGGLATKAYRASTGAELALEFQSLTGVTIAKGDVTVRDLHDAVPHVYSYADDKEWTVKMWNARAADIMTVLTVFYTAGNAIPGVSLSGYLAMDGMEVTWRPDAPNANGERIPVITGVTIGGEPIDLNRRYRVAVTDGFMISLEIVKKELGIPLDLDDVTDTGIEDWISVVSYGTSVRNLTARGIREGARGYTTTADPAIFHYSMALNGPYLDVLVANDGLEASQTAKLRCSKGKWNDFVDFDTDDEEPYQVFAEADVLPMEPLQERIVRLDWPKGPEAGYVGIECELLSASDGHTGNNHARTVLHVQ